MSHDQSDGNSVEPLERRDGQTCADCCQQPPATQTNYTLISARHGWRLSRSIDADGRKVMRWRCPDCWKRYRTGGK